MKKKKEQINVVELFAGVGGFRLGLEGWKGKSASSGYTEDFDSPFKVVWSNQFEPSTKVQHASKVYELRFGSKGHVNKDIFPYPTDLIPDHEMLVGGFPCQDYSVARTLNKAEGLIGKKGVLWWAIHRILDEKRKNRPDFVFLENVDRLLKSPARQRGRDFAIMLASLSDLGYVVEWRIVNAADYGMPQRRRRIFIFAFQKDSKIGQEYSSSPDPIEWILRNGIFARSFPVDAQGTPPVFPFQIEGGLEAISENFPAQILGLELKDRPELGNRSPFQNSGLLVDRHVSTLKTTPKAPIEKPVVLGDIVYRNGKIPDDSPYYLSPESLATWEYLKGAKKDNLRRSKSGFEYHYNEGPLAFPDPLEKPSRTIITGEGGPSPSRFKHVVEIQPGSGRFRRLIPEELEMLNMFPPGHTEMEGISDVKRAFFMGNALVVGVVERVARELSRRIAA